MQLSNPLRRLHAEERGIALIVAMAMLLILGIIAAAVFTNALQIKNATATERSGKQAYAAAVNGLRSAMYWLNASAPSDTSCPPLPGQTLAQVAGGSGVCGPYESDNMSGLTGVTTQPLVGQRFTYWISPVLSSGSDTCTGTPPRVTSGASGVTVRDRCITAVGQSLVGTQIKSTRRIQARVSATNAAFPVPGIFGAACLSAGVNFQPTATDCSTQGSGVSTSDYYGTVGSNGPVNMNIKNWNYDPLTNPDAGASLYLGALSPSDPTTPPYSIKLQNNPVGTPTPTGCPGSGLNYCTGSQPPLPYNTSATGPYQNPVHELGRWYQPFRMGNYFARPDQFAPMKLPGNSLPVGCTNFDVSVCNNNALITSASGTPANCATISTNRTLTIASNCVLRFPNGTYDFCDISFGQDSSILPTDTTANAEVRIFLDNKTRTTAAAPCANSTQGSINWPSGGGHPARWMTTGPASVAGPQLCPTAFPDTWTALAGQLFIYGAGDSSGVDTNYPVNTSPQEIPGMMFDGSIMATNTMLNVSTSNTCINGGIAAGRINLANNVGFKWDPNIGKSELSSTSTTFYRTAFSTCTSAGFRFPSTTTAPSYPTNPSTGC